MFCKHLHSVLFLAPEKWRNKNSQVGHKCEGYNKYFVVLLTSHQSIKNLKMKFYFQINGPENTRTG